MKKAASSRNFGVISSLRHSRGQIGCQSAGYRFNAARIERDVYIRCGIGFADDAFDRFHAPATGHAFNRKKQSFSPRKP